MEKRISVIINPASGNGRTKKHVKKIIKEIKNLKKDTNFFITQNPLHATDLAKIELKKGVDRIIAVGGDGTLNEVVNGFFDDKGGLYNDKASLGLIPSGSGSDFFRNMNAGDVLQAKVLHALTSEAKPTDVGYIQAKDEKNRQVERYFINVASAGLSGMVAGLMKQTTRKLGATAAYFFATVKALKEFTPPNLRLTSENGEIIVENCSISSFANGKYYGSGMKIAPEAQLDDGLFDCVSIKNLSAWFFMLHGYKVYQGTHLDLDKVDFMRCKECLVESLDSGPVYVETDGELFAQLPAKFVLKKHQLLVAR